MIRAYQLQCTQVAARRRQPAGPAVAAFLDTGGVKDRAFFEHHSFHTQNLVHTRENLLGDPVHCIVMRVTKVVLLHQVLVSSAQGACWQRSVQSTSRSGRQPSPAPTGRTGR